MDHPFYRNNWAAPFRHRYHPPATAHKVVSIPVDFVGSEAHRRQIDPSAAAVRIQKAARGFLVRKNMRTVRKIAAEAEEMARRIEISAEVICRDDRERLRIGEMLMALLLRLDSVRGVRDYRKTVIRRVIQLQEAVDSVTATNTADATASAEQEEESEAMMMVEENKADDDPMMDEVPECAWPEEEEEEPSKAEAEQEEKSVGITGEEEGPQGGLTLAVEELVGLKEMMEKLKGLVAVLCERSVQQCELMNGLVQRVEQLERKVHSTERKKKKKRQAVVANKKKE